jgi:hypothetical protein
MLSSIAGLFCVWGAGIAGNVAKYCYADGKGNNMFSPLSLNVHIIVIPLPHVSPVLYIIILFCICLSHRAGGVCSAIGIGGSVLQGAHSISGCGFCGVSYGKGWRFGHSDI